jgi:hypothetical protein
MCRRIYRLAFLLVLLSCLAGWSGNGFAAVEDQVGRPSLEDQDAPPAAAPPTDCRQLAAQIDLLRSLISRENGQIKRELAAMREDLSRPGFQEIFAGIGYILGLAGIGLYVHARRERAARKRENEL